MLDSFKKSKPKCKNQEKVLEYVSKLKILVNETDFDSSKCPKSSTSQSSKEVEDISFSPRNVLTSQQSKEFKELNKNEIKDDVTRINHNLEKLEKKKVTTRVNLIIMQILKILKIKLVIKLK